MKFQRILLSGLVIGMFIILTMGNISSAQDIEDECWDSGYCNPCSSAVTALDPGIARIYYSDGNFYAEFDVSIGGKTLKNGITESATVNLYSTLPGYAYQSRGGCSIEDVGCGSCNTTVHVKQFIGDSSNIVLFKVMVMTRDGSGIGQCGCTAIIAYPVSIPPKDPERTVPPCLSQIADPIDARSGNVYYEQRDVSIGSWSGLPIIFTHSYNSTAFIDPTSILGPKWTHNFNYRIWDAGNGYAGFATGTGQILQLKDGTYPYGIGSGYQVTFDSVTDCYTVLEFSTARRFAFNENGFLDTLYDREYGRLFFTYSGDTLTQVTDANGRYLTFHYNVNGKLGAIHQLNGETVAEYEYDPSVGDTLKKVTYSNGDWESYHYKSVYPAKGLLDIIETSDGAKLKFDYDAMGRGIKANLNDTMNVEDVLYRMVFHEHPAGQDTTFFVTIADGSEKVTYESIFTSDSTRRIHTKVINNDCGGCGSKFDYDDDFRTSSITYANGRKDSLDNGLYGTIDRFWRDYGGPDERMTTYTYGGDYYQLQTTYIPSMYSAIAPYEVIFGRDSEGNITSIRHLGRDGWWKAFDYSASFTYGEDGELLRVDCPKAGDADTTAYTYYDNGDLRYIALANDDVYEFDTLDNLGNLIWMKSPNGDTTRFVYDDYGRITRVTRGVGGNDSMGTSYEHNYAGNITKVIHPKGDFVEYSYDNNGLLKDIQNQRGEKVHYEYDAYSRPILEAVVDTLDDTMKFERYQYTSRGQLESITNPGGSFSHFDYDDMGNCVMATDANGNYIGYKYDNLNRLDTIWQFNGGTGHKTAFEYDANGNITSVVDPDSNVYSYLYGDDGRLVYDSSGPGGVTHYLYDEARNLAAVENAAGDSINFSYDDLYRLTRIAYPDSQNVDYQYDGTQYPYGHGRLYKEKTPSCTTTYKYDRFGRLATEYRRTVGDTVRTTTYIYDINDNVTSVTYPSALKYLYHFDDLNRVIMITWTKSTGHYAFDTLVYNIKYDPFGDAVEWTLGNGIVVSQSHDLRYFTDSITTDTFNIMGRVYTYDSVGNVRVTKDLFDSRNNATFTYDSLYQLTSAASSRYPDSVRLFDYHKNGDRYSLVVDTGVNQRTISYEYTDGKLMRIDDTLDTYLSYDASGNLTKWRTDNDSTTFEYNDAGQMVSVDGGGTAQYLYDGRGQRVKAVAGTSGRYIYYDQFGRIISEFRTSVIKWDRDFVYLNGRILAKLEKHYDGGISKMEGESEIDGFEPPPPLPLPTDIDIFYFHNDRLGTPLVVTNSNRDSVWAGRYYPFGELSYEWVSNNNNIRFSGQWHDRETGLYYNWHRYYDPKTGRYISVDPLGISGSGSLYGYARNNPLSFTDPTGLWVPVYNPNGNRIGVTMEPGDKLTDLTNQLGVSYEEFARRHSVNNVFFDITDYVPIKKDFNPAGSPSKNCHGFASYAGGVGTQEGLLNKLQVADNMRTKAPHTGDWAVFFMTGYYQYEGQPTPQNATGQQGHSAIYILHDRACEDYYLNRINTGKPVSINSENEIGAYYANHENVQKGINALGQGYRLVRFPSLNSTPKFYRR